MNERNFKKIFLQLFFLSTIFTSKSNKINISLENIKTCVEFSTWEYLVAASKKTQHLKNLVTINIPANVKRTRAASNNQQHAKNGQEFCRQS